MIGRFSSLGAYKGLFALKEFVLCLAGGGLAVAAFILQPASGLSWPAVLLGLASVAINGLPIIVGAVRGVMERRVNVDSWSVWPLSPPWSRARSSPPPW